MQKTHEKLPALLTVGETARRLSVSPWWVYRRGKEVGITIKVGRHLRVDPRLLEAYLQTCRDNGGNHEHRVGSSKPVLVLPDSKKKGSGTRVEKRVSDKKRGPERRAVSPRKVDLLDTPDPDRTENRHNLRGRGK